MPTLSREEREGIAQRRIRNILRQHAIATTRTLEQKISDAGPNNQRVDPPILTTVRSRMVTEGSVLVREHGNGNWFYLPSTSPDVVAARFDAQLPTWQAISQQNFSKRVGQALEIATYRALLGLAKPFTFLGQYRDLDKHDDSLLYQKEEPPSHLSGLSTTGAKRLDFLVQHPSAGWLGIECKNVREWLYPQQTEVLETLRKCLALDCVPVFIARRIPFVTFRLLRPCGVIFHQTYNQLFPSSEQAIADAARDKMILGYHDVRVGNAPDARLNAFILRNLPSVASDARERFEHYKDLLTGYAENDLTYKSFAARVRRRSEGTNEDIDEPDFDPEDN